MGIVSFKKQIPIGLNCFLEAKLDEQTATVAKRFEAEAFLKVTMLLLMSCKKITIRISSLELITDGIYTHIRHPQYVGMILITIGFLIQWPTIITLAMWPILLFLYDRLSKYEEKKLATKFGKEFYTYQSSVPAIFPRS